MFNSDKNNAVRLDALRVSSLLALRLSCLQACGGDVDRARQLCDYIADGLNLPATEPATPGTLDRLRAGADEILAWVSSHRDDLGQGVALVQGLIQAIKAGNTATK